MKSLSENLLNSAELWKIPVFDVIKGEKKI